MAASEMAKMIPIQCVDNVCGCPGVVVYDHETFPMSTDQAVRPWGSTFNDGHGLESSVRVFQEACTSNVAPSSPHLDKEEPMETD